MKHILLSILLVLGFNQLQAQATLSLMPATVMMDVDPMEFETIAHSYIKNNGEDTVTVQWIRTVEEISMGWQSAICDINACYAVEVDTTPSEFLLKLAPGDSSMLNVYIRPSGIEGSAKIKVTVVEVDNKDNAVAAEYLFNQSTPARDLTETRAISIFPNPAVNHFQLSDYQDVSEVAIYNLVGSELLRYSTFPGAQFNIGDLQRGIYLVRIIDYRNEVIKTLRLNKR